jgi:hippurate hydrolase
MASSSVRLARIHRDRKAARMTAATRDLAVQWRHRLHRIPETGFEEHATGDEVASILAELGIDCVRGVGGTGIVATVRCGSGTGSVGLRADMDGLPIDEQTGLAYSSTHAGRMHACGHDGHMAMVLAAAARLKDEGGFDGIVHFVFQPAEEHGLGAKAMLADGLLDRFPMDAMYGIHNIPGIPAGHVHTRAGGVMASEDNFEIRITGRGGHAARPQMVVDPIVIGAEIVLALQTIVARTIDPTKPAVVSCTEFITDGARNAIPGQVVVKGDTRSFDPQVQALLESRMRELCVGIAAAHGASCQVAYTHEFEPTVNDAGCVAAAAAAAITVVGADRVDADCPPFMGSEDFGAFGRALPSCFVFLGNGTEPEAGGTPLHSRDYDFNDQVLHVGVDYYVELVRSLLPSEVSP